MTDVVVAGAGLAGACAAFALSRTRRVVVLEADHPAAGASGAAAGLVNPFMGRKAKRAWRADEALDALAELDAEAGGGLRQTGVLRPAVSRAQASVFADRATAHGALGWIGPEAAAERYPHVRAPHGLLVAREGGSVAIPALVAGLLAAAERHGAEVVRARLTGWRREGDSIIAITDRGDVRAAALVCALGDGARALPVLAALLLHRVKGQTVWVDRPAALPADHPAVAGAGYAVPAADAVVVGATFEHVFATLAPDPALDAGLVANAQALLPALAGAAVVGRRAGVRLTVPSTVSPRRLPLAGEVEPGVWVLSGLGAKGLLTAPLLARRLPDALDGRTPMPPEVWPLGPA